MNRCIRSLATSLGAGTGLKIRFKASFKARLDATVFVAACALFAPASMLFSSNAQAQMVRSFPEKAQRGSMVVGAAPEIRINGKAERLSPGSRIRSATNMLVQPSNIAGAELAVNFTREPGGMVHEVWILNAAELADKGEQARKGGNRGNITFASESTPVTDDGKTPYNQLPRYKQPQ